MRYLVDLDRFIRLKRRNLLLAFLASTSLSLSAETTALADVSIVIDASTALTESDSGDDLATLQNIFQSANAPAEPAIDELKPIMADVKMKRMRLLQSDINCDLDSNGQFGTWQGGVVVAGDCYPLLWHLHWALDNGLSPHVAVAAYMPPSFVSYGAAETWPQAILDRYSLYAEQLVRYIATTAFDAGAQSVVFEVSNELDGADLQPENWNSTDPSVYALKPLGPGGRWLWWINPASYDLYQWPPAQAHYLPYSDVGLAYPYGTDIRRLDRQLSPVQKIFADKIQTVRKEFGTDKTIEIAGPALAGLSFVFNPGMPSLEEGFLDQMLNPAITGGKYNTELDHFSFHYYGSTDGTAPFTTFKRMTDTIKAKLAALGHPEIKLFLSEWGPFAGSESDINYSHKGAAWVAAFLTKAVAEKIAMGSYLIVDDGLVGQATFSNPSMASLAHKDVAADGSVHYYPKAPANVFKMFANMTGTRRPATLSTTGSTSNLGTFATSDANSVSIVVFNYNSTLVFENTDGLLPDTPENFVVDVNNLPFNGEVTVRQYLVDATTSNLKAFYSPPYPDPSLQMVVGSPFNAMVENGRLILPSYPLKLGVTFYQISRASMTNSLLPLAVHPSR